MQLSPSSRVVGTAIGFMVLPPDRAGFAEVRYLEPDPRRIERIIASASGNRVTVHPVARGESPDSLRPCLSAKRNQESAATEAIINKFLGVFGNAKFIDVERDTRDVHKRQP